MKILKIINKNSMNSQEERRRRRITNESIGILLERAASERRIFRNLAIIFSRRSKLASSLLVPLILLAYDLALIPISLIVTPSFLAATAAAAAIMSQSSKLLDLVEGSEFAAALKFLASCDDATAREQLTIIPLAWNWNALMMAARCDTPADLIRAMVKRGPHGYINRKNELGTAATLAVWDYRPVNLDLLLTLGADPKGCREAALRSNSGEACRTVLARFELRTTLACCLRHYDDLHQTHVTTIPPEVRELLKQARKVRDLHPDFIAWSTIISCLSLHPDIAALSPVAKLFHDLHGINGPSHDLSRMILSFL
jgi:hypothetical protein